MKIEKMSKRETTQRQLLIVTHLRKSPATFEEIDKMLKKESAFYQNGHFNGTLVISVNFLA